MSSTSRPRIDLLLSDVVLPGGTSGPEVMDQAKRFNPDLKVLFMSGYAGNALRKGGHGDLKGTMILINKPFQKRELARKLREALAK